MNRDDRLMATHVSLFAALFIQWQRNNFLALFLLPSGELMTHSKIASVATYHKCIGQLDNYGHISYQPNYHPQKGSLVYWPEILV
ncbi:MAG: hypothetical protein JST50_11265 [Bacteroidetes bacterium]|jgi:hypothetical protein|nr:hypothetical protein [Bacteroidota bacterium]